jgi:molecular chaperone GrpE
MSQNDEYREPRRAPLATDDVEALKRENQALVAENEQLRQASAEQAEALQEARKRHQRAVADGENTRKRLQREMTQVGRGERDKVVRQWLDAVDSVDRALQMGGEDAETWRQGVVGIHRQMMDVLKRHQIKPMETDGVIFDPHKHEAVGAVPHPQLPAGTVLHTQRAGYQTAEGEVVRPALVVVVQE